MLKVLKDGTISRIASTFAQPVNQSIYNAHTVEIESDAREKSLGIDKSNAEIKTF